MEINVKDNNYTRACNKSDNKIEMGELVSVDTLHPCHEAI